MNISPIIEQTRILNVDNKEIKVSSLPEDLRFEVGTLDRFNQQKLDLLMQLEMVELALNSQRMKLGELVRRHLQPPIVEPGNIGEASEKKTHE